MSLDENPFAPPSAELHQPGSESPILADRALRLSAALIDGVLYLVPLLAFAIIIGARESLLATQAPVVILFAVLAVVALPQCYLISTRGQSLGKWLLHIRIERMNGEPCGFVHGVLLRSWLVTALGQIPLFGTFFGLVNVLMIFRPDRRCLHDHLADTQVVNVSESELMPRRDWAP